MAKSKLFIILLIVLVVLSSGCVKKSTGDQKAAQVAFVGGSQGLVMSFLPQQPPSEIPESTPGSEQTFSIGLQIDNKGESKVTPNANIYLTGFDTGSFKIKHIEDTKDLGATANTGAIDGVLRIQQQVIPSAPVFVTFDGVARTVDVDSSFNIQAVAIYPYQTKAVATVCLKESLIQQSIGGPEVCKLSGSKPVESAGAPVKVTSVEENPNGFVIKVRNVGGGAPFVREGNTAERESEITLGQQNKVKISAVIDGGSVKVETCAPETVILQNNEGQTFCRAPKLANAGADFTDILKVTIDYGYLTKASTTMRIINLG